MAHLPTTPRSPDYSYATEELLLPYHIPPLEDCRQLDSTSSTLASEPDSEPIDTRKLSDLARLARGSGESKPALDSAVDRPLPGPDGLARRDDNFAHPSSFDGFGSRVTANSTTTASQRSGAIASGRRTVSFRDRNQDKLGTGTGSGANTRSDLVSSAAAGSDGRAPAQDEQIEPLTWTGQLERIIDSTWFAVVIGFITLFVLFVDDISVLAGVSDPEHGGLGYALLVIKVVTFVIFLTELAVSSVVKDAYFASFFFWLDVVTLVSFVPDLVLLFGPRRPCRASCGPDPVLFRVMKVLKLSHKQTVSASIDKLEDHATMYDAAESSRPGGIVLRAMTNKVTALVLIVYISTAMFQTDPDWSQHSLSALMTLEAGSAAVGSPAALLPAFLHPYTARVKVVRLFVNGVLQLDGHVPLRRDFRTTISTPSQASSILLNISEDRRMDALFSLMSLVVVIVGLGVGNLVICHSANKLVVISEHLMAIMRLLTSHLKGATSTRRGSLVASDLAPTILSDLPSVSVFGYNDTQTTLAKTATDGSGMSRLRPPTATSGHGSGGGGAETIISALAFWDEATSHQVGYVEGIEEQLQRYLVDNMRVELEAKQARRREAELRSLVRLAASRQERARAHVERLITKIDALKHQVWRYRQHLSRTTRRRLDEEDAEDGSNSALAELSDVGSVLSVVTLRSGARMARDAGLTHASDPSLTEAPEETQFVSEHDTVFVERHDGAAVVVRGTVNGLIEQLTTLSGTPSTEYLRTFLYTFRRYTHPQHVLERLLIRYCIAPPQAMRHMPLNAGMQHYDLELGDASMNWALEVEVPIRNRVQQVLYYWVTNCFVDFVDSPPLLDLLRRAIDNVFNRTTAPFASRLAAVIANQLDSGGLSRPPPRRIRLSIAAVPTPRIPLSIGQSTAVAPSSSEPADSSPSVELSITDIDPLELARQLKLLDHEIYCQVQVWELFDAAWESPAREQRAQNVLALGNVFSARVFWFRSLILSDGLSSREQAHILEYLIEVGTASVEIYSFNAAVAVLGVLKDHEVGECSSAWRKISSSAAADYDAFKAVFSRATDFAPYRERLVHHRTNVLERAADDGGDPTLPPTAVPYLGFHLEDLFDADENNPDYTDDSLVNFQKCTLMASLIDFALAWRDTAPCFVPVDTIQDFIRDGQLSAVTTPWVPCTAGPLLTPSGAAGLGDPAFDHAVHDSDDAISATDSDE
ncbi:Ras guanine nucleotide exchange factor A [Thecamonas trahens ATCC 50062]|uniref:Ras guanine nucleotide exchange factor A n=1 Tax=Thecamonas trahens ATCC 50062 TaxID=461836 RepID=A0A0L0DK24_THETB|nr:Ras guanine nucleotide exchange factor A [Thecamonas trahens ATCC 50062]KNC51693.1 Ras guanine nucleotide exchange factor A [Thecamonas trahens ATCC 50062]|eukprot:XP_013755822.1 Ras guanine nucleotide exchange factor A [Thecamonas trahens ATCC 50062]